MNPITLKQLARLSPFHTPLFSIKPADTQKADSRQIKRQLAAAACNGKKFFIQYSTGKESLENTHTDKENSVLNWFINIDKSVFQMHECYILFLECDICYLTKRHFG